MRYFLQTFSKTFKKINRQFPEYNACFNHFKYGSLFNKQEERRPTLPPAHAFIVQRLFCSKQEPTKLHIMDFSLLVWPNVIKFMKNWFLSGLIVRPYFDPDFSLYQFVEGSQQAAEVVSRLISAGKVDELQGLVTPECLEAVRIGISNLNAKQLSDIAIQKEDIYFSFPYEVGVIYDDKTNDTGSSAILNT